MLNGIHTGQINQEKKINPMAAHQTMDGSELFIPIQTCASVNC